MSPITVKCVRCRTMHSPQSRCTDELQREPTVYQAPVERQKFSPFMVADCSRDCTCGRCVLRRIGL